MTKRHPPPSSPERSQALALLQAMYHAHNELLALLRADKDWSKALFPGALYMEEDPQFFRWLKELCRSLQLPLEEVLRHE